MWIFETEISVSLFYAFVLILHLEHTLTLSLMCSELDKYVLDLRQISDKVSCNLLVLGHIGILMVLLESKSSRSVIINVMM